MLAKLLKLLAEPYPRIVERDRVTVLEINAQLAASIPSPDRPDDLARANEGMTLDRQLALFLALLKRHPDVIDNADVAEFERRLKASHS